MEQLFQTQSRSQSDYKTQPGVEGRQSNNFLMILRLVLDVTFMKLIMFVVILLYELERGIVVLLHVLMAASPATPAICLINLGALIFWAPIFTRLKFVTTVKISFY